MSEPVPPAVYVWQRCHHEDSGLYGGQGADVDVVSRYVRLLFVFPTGAKIFA
jgi:uncharacterized protein (DUF2235 family)